jgi:endo-1,4-beta-mannosidase
MGPQREMEVELACDLTEEEVQYRAQQLGAAVVEQDEVTSRKREAMKSFNEELEEIAQRMRLLSRSIRTKSERRLVRCTVAFHTPTQASKRTVRLDTGELVRDEPMSLDECQQHLFEPE